MAFCDLSKYQVRVTGNITCMVMFKRKRTPATRFILSIVLLEVARIAEKAIFELDAPVIRVGSDSLPYPFPGYENYYIPNELKISKAIDRVLE